MKWFTSCTIIEWENWSFHYQWLFNGANGAKEKKPRIERAKNKKFFGQRFVVERNNDNKKRNLKPVRLVSGISTGLTPILGRIKFTAGRPPDRITRVAMTRTWKFVGSEFKSSETAQFIVTTRNVCDSCGIFGELGGIFSKHPEFKVLSSRTAGIRGSHPNHPLLDKQAFSYVHKFLRH